ncbi:MAG: Dabb family protein [Clostridia bacterium]|nr:Dabb family protein [Clostridia bacterium]
MKHIELYRLAPGADAVQVQERLWKALRKLDDELDWLNHPVVYRRCGEVGEGFDLMASFELEGEGQLEAYRAHPATQKLADKLEGLVTERETFDHY